MSTVLSKLTMCVCAAGTGAAIVPTAHAVQRHFKPRPAAHRVARPQPAMAAIAAQDDCLPAAMSAPLGDGLTTGSGAANGLFAPAALPAGGSSGGFPVAFGGGVEDDRPGGGFGGVPGGGGLPGPGGPGPGGPGPGGPGSPPSPPSASPAPEPTSWALMAAGFGVLGGAMRYRQVRAVA